MPCYLTQSVHRFKGQQPVKWKIITHAAHSTVHALNQIAWLVAFEKGKLAKRQNAMTARERWPKRNVNNRPKQAPQDPPGTGRYVGWTQ